MMKKNFIIIYIIIFFIFIILPGCGGGDADMISDDADNIPSDYELKNTLFPNSTLIETGIPLFNDIVSTTPTFSWKATGQKFIYLGIFLNNITVKNNTIVNINDNIWAWHSGLGTGREGNVKFLDGLDVINGELQVGYSPTPLKNTQDYIWAVWAWDNDGIKITHSSQEMYFWVE